MRRPAVPYLEPLAGGLWWTVGSAALNPGAGTVMLAAGLGLTGWLVHALRKRHGSGALLPPGGLGRLLRIVGITAVLVIGAGIGLGYTQFGELAVPVACAMAGLALFPISSLLDERSLMATGGALLVLGAAGALLAFDSAGALYPQGVVGLVAGGLLWLAGAYRAGLLSEVRSRVRRRGGAQRAEPAPRPGTIEGS